VKHLFSFSEKRRKFTLKSDVEGDKMKITVSKLESIKSVASIGKKKCEKTTSGLLRRLIRTFRPLPSSFFHYIFNGFSPCSAPFVPENIHTSSVLV